ncbi:MAG: ribose-5-phosphate isomerase RpiA [Pseudomonadota bacterium]
MDSDLSPQDRAKRAAAIRAADFVRSGMKVGLGTGSTSVFLVQELGRRVRAEGLSITAVATSVRTADLAREEGIEVVSLDAAEWLDLTIDGADEFDPAFNLIKGGGGALLREKVVATASDRMIVIADAGKAVEILGAYPLPVEVLGFGLATTRQLIEATLSSLDVLGRDVALRLDGDTPCVTDEGNHILDLHLKRIANPRQVALVLNQLPGVVENGLFVDICDDVVVGHPDGRVEMRQLAEMAIPLSRADAPDNLFDTADE